MTFRKSLQFNVAILLFIYVVQINGRLECGRIAPTLRGNLTFLITNSLATNHWPWHVAIYHILEEGEDPAYQCGGSLISRNWILTAAHCVSDDDSSMDVGNVLISLGRRFLNDTETGNPTLEVDKIVLYPGFSMENHKNDIAVVRLRKKVKFNRNVRPICLWRSNETDISTVLKAEGTVVGWGKTETGDLSMVLRIAKLPIASWSNCLDSNRPFFGLHLADTNFCAGIRNGTSVCSGDSGGGLTFNKSGTFYIRGIVSVSPAQIDYTNQAPLCDTTQYAVFTDVAQYLPWITFVAGMKFEVIVTCNLKFAEYGACYLDDPPPTFINPIQEHKLIFNEPVNERMRHIYLENVTSKSFPDFSDALTKFKNLEALTVTYCEIEIVFWEELMAFEQLKKLHLRNNRISQYQNAFADLKNLETLDLYDNQFNELHEDLFKELANLEDIYLDTNIITTLPSGLFRNNRRLRKIGLSGNQLRELNRDIFVGLHSLRTVHLNENQLEIITRDHFRDNKELLVIDLANNRIKKIDFDVYNFPNFEVISLSGNVCIDAHCQVETFCGTSSLFEMNEKIARNCSGSNKAIF